MDTVAPALTELADQRGGHWQDGEVGTCVAFLRWYLDRDQKEAP